MIPDYLRKPYGKPEENILRLQFSMVKERVEVAKIHAEELADSGLAALGEDFLMQFYYGVLLNDPDYYCYIYIVDGVVGGFTSFSINSRKVCQRAVCRYWPGLSWAVVKRIIRKPATILTVWKLTISLLSMKNEPYSDVLAEGMSTAVAKPYRSIEFFRKTGINIGRTLYMEMARVLAKMGVRKIKGYTRKANVFVSASLGYLGWKKVVDSCNPRGLAKEELSLWILDLDAQSDSSEKQQQ